MFDWICSVRDKATSNWTCCTETPNLTVARKPRGNVSSLSSLIPLFSVLSRWDGATHTQGRFFPLSEPYTRCSGLL